MKWLQALGLVTAPFVSAVYPLLRAIEDTLRRAKPNYTLMTLLGLAGELLLVTIVCIPSIAAKSKLEINDRPIIGIVTQFWRPDKGTGETYIASSYVKFVEAAGARVLPIQQDLDDTELENRFRAINGLLIPGGGAALKPGHLFFDTVTRLFNLAVQANDRGSYFPILAVCLGLEALVTIVSQNYTILSRYDAVDSAAILTPTPAANGSRFIGSLRPDILEDLYSKPFARESHAWGLSPAAFSADQRLTEFFRVLTLSTDRQDKAYVSTIEAQRYPVTALQWHPEKNAFEWGDKWHIPHSAAAVEVSHEVARVFVNQARQNGQRLASVVEEDELLIYNYQPTFTGKHTTEDDRWTFDEAYIFPQTSYFNRGSDVGEVDLEPMRR